MEKDHLSRKLAVILHADVVGSTALVQKNETLAHQRIQDAFQQFSEVIKTYSGIAREIRGDALVAEFDRASDAVTAALAFQVSNGEHNSTLEEDIQPQLRIGISLGEVIIADDTITGAGVVLAQRLEQLADAGGVVVQGAVSETVPARMPFEFESMGEMTLKGFDYPVRSFAVRLRPGEELPAPEADATAKTSEPEGLQVPDKPSIAVLPLDNMSGDPKQEYFSDGITEDIITELSRFSMLYVVARHSSFAFKGEKVNIKEVAEKLGVQYVVEGSVRRAGNQARITAQLIDAESGKHIWGERYDRELDDIFAVQDEVTRAIVATIAAQLGKTVSENAARKATKSIKSYEYLLQANRQYYRFNPDDNIAAAQLYQKAIERDPQFSRAYAGLANTYTTDYFLGWLRTKNALQNGLEYAHKALEFDGNDALARIVLAWALIGTGSWEEAELELDRVLTSRPGDADILAEAGNGFKAVGRLEIGIALLEEAIRLNPLFPDTYQRWLGQAYYRGGRYQEAINTLRAVRVDGWGYGVLAASFARVGELEHARDALNKFITQRQKELKSSGMSASTTADLLGNYRDNFRTEVEWQHLLDGLHMAGLTE
jgi:adenylate cyclase